MLRKILSSFAVLLLLAVASSADAGRPTYNARLCNNCAFGSKAQNCVKCGKWAPNNYAPARICSNCGFGSKSQYCFKCGKWVPRDYTEARLCSACSFGSKKDNCVKCGKWLK